MGRRGAAGGTGRAMAGESASGKPKPARRERGSRHREAPASEQPFAVWLIVYKYMRLF
mgnify:CR=1 FL=1